MAPLINQVTPPSVAFVPINTNSQNIENDHCDQKMSSVDKAVGIKSKNRPFTEDRDARRV